jgi:hypothetical protein
MIEYNQMIDACHMARSHNLSALIEAEAKAAGALSTHFLLSWKISAALLEKEAPQIHIVRRRRTAARSRNTLC